MKKLRAVSDPSILIHLSAIGRFHLLMDLFQEIVIPEEVYEEVVVEGWGLSGSLETAEAKRFYSGEKSYGWGRSQKYYT